MLSAIPFNRLWQQGHDLSNYKPILTPPSQIHGWPDLSLGWRYQIPLLVSLGLRVVAPDMMGYGGTVRTPLHIHSTKENRPEMGASNHVLTHVCGSGRPQSAPQPHQPLRPQARIRRHRRAGAGSRRAADHPRRARLVSLHPMRKKATREREKKKELTTISRRGGFVVWRAAQWYPELVSHVFSVCSTSAPPSPNSLSP